MLILCVKSDRMSLASGSINSSSKAASRSVRGDKGIGGSVMDAGAPTKRWRLVSGAMASRAPRNLRLSRAGRLFTLVTNQRLRALQFSCENFPWRRGLGDIRHHLLKTAVHNTTDTKERYKRKKIDIRTRG